MARVCQQYAIEGFFDLKVQSVALQCEAMFLKKTLKKFGKFGKSCYLCNQIAKNRWEYNG